MIPTRTSALGALVVGWLLGCADPQAGTSTQTENHIGMRVIRVDSVLPLRNPASQGPTVATLRLDASNFDFSLADSTG